MKTDQAHHIGVVDVQFRIYDLVVEALAAQ